MEKTLDRSLDCRVRPIILKEISPEYLLERLMLKLKLQFWPPDTKNTLIRKDPDACRQAESGTTEDETVGWHH